MDDLSMIIDYIIVGNLACTNSALHVHAWRCNFLGVEF